MRPPRERHGTQRGAASGVRERRQVHSERCRDGSRARTILPHSTCLMRSLNESSPSSNMQVGGSGVARARDTHADLGRESAALIIRHVIGRGCYIWVIEPSPASRVVDVEQPLAAARPEGHISPSVISRCGTLSRPTAGDGVREGHSQVSVVCSVRK